MTHWTDDLIQRLKSPSSSDRDAQRKKTALVTDLQVVGITNPRLIEWAAEYKKLLENETWEEIIDGCDRLFCETGILEAQVFALKLLARFKRRFDRLLWERIDDNWFAHIDNWASCDHLFIDVVGYYPLLDDRYLEELREWSKSEDPWRRRVSFSSMIRFVRNTKNNELSAKAVDFVLELQSTLINDKAYYVRKAIPWLLRECTKTHPDKVEVFIREHLSSFKRAELKDASRKLSPDVHQGLLDGFNSM